MYNYNDYNNHSNRCRIEQCTQCVTVSACNTVIAMCNSDTARTHPSQSEKRGGLPPNRSGRRIEQADSPARDGCNLQPLQRVIRANYNYNYNYNYDYNYAYDYNYKYTRAACDACDGYNA